jgi:putative FmdB family regulatory protein
MPIYAYRCSTCGHAQDVLQKISDPLLSVCPACGAATYVKQVTAAGFQLKGSGWYVTDFRGDKKPAAKSGEGTASEGSDKGDKGGDKPASGSDGGTAAEGGAKKPDAGSAAAPAPSTSSTSAAPSPSPAPAAPSTPSAKSGS